MENLIETYYQKIKTEVELGHRGLLMLDSTQVSNLYTLIPSIKNEEIGLKFLTILAHFSHPHLVFEEWIINQLSDYKNLNPEAILMALKAFRENIIKGYQKDGQKIPSAPLKSLFPLLHHKNPDVVEWCLRTIDDCGHQGIIFKNDFDKITPPFWKMFFQSQRNIRELIEFMKRKWMIHE